MLLTAKTPQIQRFRIHDCTGALISFAQSYNTDTKEVSLYLQAVRPSANLEEQPRPALVHQPSKVNEKGEVEEASPVVLSFVLQGSYATFDGKMVEKDFVLPEEAVTVEQAPEMKLDVVPEAEMEVKQEDDVEKKEEPCECECKECKSEEEKVA